MVIMVIYGWLYTVHDWCFHMVISDKNGQDTIEQCKGQVTTSLRGYSYTFSFLKLQSAVNTKIYSFVSVWFFVTPTHRWWNHVHIPFLQSTAPTKSVCLVSFHLANCMWTFIFCGFCICTNRLIHGTRVAVEGDQWALWCCWCRGSLWLEWFDWLIVIINMARYWHHSPALKHLVLA